MSDAASRAGAVSGTTERNARSAFRDARDDLSLLRWVWGWHPIVSPVIIIILMSGVGYYVGGAYLFTVAGIVASGPIWYQGMRYINRNWEPVREGYMQDVERVAPAVLEAAGMDGSGSVHTLVDVPAETLPFVEAPSKVEATLVGVDETALWIYDQTELDLMFLKAPVGTVPDLVDSIPLGAIESVAYEDGTFVVETAPDSGEGTVSAPAAEPPRDLLAAVRGRIESASDAE
ncbi:MAG: hypothetical protein ABEJ60_03800 [Halodesulfurarchaeum sp.]